MYSTPNVIKGIRTAALRGLDEPEKLGEPEDFLDEAEDLDETEDLDDFGDLDDFLDDFEDFEDLEERGNIRPLKLYVPATPRLNTEDSKFKFVATDFSLADSFPLIV